jgi:hypothetical protein
VTHRLVRKTSALSCSFLRIAVTVVPPVRDCQIGPQLKTSVKMVLQNSGKVVPNEYTYSKCDI